jgi:hypothetical protein
MRHDTSFTLLAVLQLIIPLTFLGIWLRIQAMRPDTFVTFLTLLQVIIPLTFLGIWSRTTLLNRKGQPSRSRTTRGPGRIGRPGRPDPMWERDLDA